MARVLQLAERGCRTTSPNPMVGCVIVNEGKIVGEAAHERTGEAHAERLALQMARGKARGATAYVNLEPCCHQGRTPPCTDALIDAGVRRVVSAMLDPNPLVAGGGIELLNRAGIETEVGLCADQAEWLNRGFISRMRRGRPWVKLKMAATLDGRTADDQGVSQWITGEIARQDVHQERASSCAVLTGSGTLLADNPTLNARVPGIERQPARVLLDSSLRTSCDANWIKPDGVKVVYTTEQALEQHPQRQHDLVEVGVEVITLPEHDNGLDLHALLSHMGQRETNFLMVEAGATLSGAFLEAGCVDELILYYGGSVLGDKGRSMFDVGASIPFASRFHYAIQDASMLGGDIKVRAIKQ